MSDTITAIHDEASAITVAKAIDSEIRTIARQLARGWVELGVRLLAVRSKRLFTELGFDTFGAYLQDLDLKRSTAYEVITIIERLHDVPQERLLEMTKENAKQLLRLPESKRTSEIVDSAIGLREQDFTALVNEKLGDGVVEPMVRRTLTLPASLMERFEKAISVAKWGIDTEAFEPAFEFIIQSFMQDEDREVIYDAQAGDGV